MTLRTATRKALLLSDSLWLHNGTWALTGSGWVNTPVLGSELLTDGGLEVWTSATNLTSWGETIAGTSTINQDTIDQRSGSNCARYDIDGSGSNAQISQSVSGLTVGNWYSTGFYAKRNATSANLSITFQDAFTYTLTTSYVFYPVAMRATATSRSLIVQRSASTGASIYLDDGTVRSLVTNQLFLARRGNNVSCRPSVVNGTQGGFFTKLDSIVNPLNGIIGFLDGVNAQLIKLVNGVYTSLISTAVTPVANGILLPVQIDADTWQLWYNGVQRGTNQSITDASIKAGSFAGAFSTYFGNVLSDVIVN